MDIDIDLPTSFDSKDYFPEWPKASMFQDGKLRKHPVGVFPQKIPTDPLSGLSAIPYKEAVELGYFKIDFLHLSVYDHFDSHDDIESLLEIPPDWTLLQSPGVVQKLFQVSKHFDVIRQIKPQSIDEMADVLAIIRPAKRYMLDTYLKDKDSVRPLLYQYDDNDAYGFKRSHSYAYALVIVLQLHLISAGINI